MNGLRCLVAGLLTVALVVTAGPATAALSAADAKNVERHTKTLTKSRNAGERADAAR